MAEHGQHNLLKHVNIVMVSMFPPSDHNRLNTPVVYKYSRGHIVLSHNETPAITHKKMLILCKKYGEKKDHLCYANAFLSIGTIQNVAYKKSLESISEFRCRH